MRTNAYTVLAFVPVPLSVLLAPSPIAPMRVGFDLEVVALAQQTGKPVEEIDANLHEVRHRSFLRGAFPTQREVLEALGVVIAFEDTAREIGALPAG